MVAGLIAESGSKFRAPAAQATASSGPAALGAGAAYSLRRRTGATGGQPLARPRPIR